MITYEASEDEFRFPFVVMLGEPCPEAIAVAAQEEQYTEKLGWANAFRLQDGQLEVLTGRGEGLVFEPLPQEASGSLEGTSWRLVAFLEDKEVEGMAAPLVAVTEPLPGTQLTIEFEDGMVSGSAGCNTYSAQYRLDGPALTLEGLAFTEMDCLDPAGVIDQEQRYLCALRVVTGYRITGHQLWLESGDGQVLLFTALER